MLAKELRELSDAELVEKLDDFKDELFKLRFQMVTGQLDNPRRLQQVRLLEHRVGKIGSCEIRHEEY
jgi:large subunit ribosomal protein L29